MTDIDTVLAGRKSQNGDYSETAAVAQNIKAAMRASENWQHLPAIHLEALEMIANKLARILNGDMMHPDHWLDIEGYARLVYTRISDNGERRAMVDKLDTLDAELAEVLAGTLR